MASQDSIQIPNLRQLQRSILAMGADKKELANASWEAGKLTADAIQTYMLPFARTGKLRSTVKARKIASKVVVVVGNNTTATYAGVVNFGWNTVGAGHRQAPQSKKRKTGKPNIKGQRFIQKALRATRQDVLDKYLDALQDLVNKYERKANNG